MVIYVTAAAIIKQSQFQWDSGKMDLRNSDFVEFINCTYVVGADNQQNKMQPSLTTKFPVFSGKPLVLLAKLRRD